MYMYTVGHSRIVSTGVYLPEARLSSTAIMDRIDSVGRFGISRDWLNRTMGIRERRVAPDDMLPSDMAALAGREALETAGLDPAEIDAIIYAGVVRDFLLEPSTAHVVQHKLKVTNAVAFDINNACHGFMNAIHLMDALIATGQVRRGLIVTGEQGTRYTFRAIEALRNSSDRGLFAKLAGGLTLGDAGAAMILGPKLEPETGFTGFMLQSQGQYAELCTCGKGHEDMLLETDMASIIAHGKAMLGEMYGVFMQKLGWAPGEISKFVAHQVGKRAFKHHADYARVSLDVMPNSVSSLGNLVTASIPLNLHRIKEDHSVKAGQKVFIAGVGSGLSISQAGLVWDAA
jgi:3-oxoacyl-[acyl-carrier-protein] synthase-3